jgi:hypothetical protein
MQSYFAQNFYNKIDLKFLINDIFILQNQKQKEDFKNTETLFNSVLDGFLWPSSVSEIKLQGSKRKRGEHGERILSADDNPGD